MIGAILENEPISRRSFLEQSVAIAGTALLNPEKLFQAPKPSVLYTGFGTYTDDWSWNASTDMVKVIERKSREQNNNRLHFLPNLSVDGTALGKGSLATITYIQSYLPNGCIVISLGESLMLEVTKYSGRLEHQAKKIPDHGQQVPENKPPAWQLSDELYGRIFQEVNNRRAEILAEEPEMKLFFSPGEDTAGGWVCERVMADLMEFSFNQARAFPPVPILPLFVHVPVTTKEGEFHPSTLKLIETITNTAANFFTENYYEPTKFVQRINP